MNKIKKIVNFKDKKIIIPLSIVGVILIIIILFGISNIVSKLSKEKKYVSEATEVEFKDSLNTDENRKSYNVDVNVLENCTCISKDECDASKKCSLDKDFCEDENDRKYCTSPTIMDCNSDNICITKLNILAYDNRGIIDFTVKNNSSSRLNGGYIKISISSYTAVLWYDAVDVGATVNGFHSYSGYNFVDDFSQKNKPKYSVTDLEDEDKSVLTSFISYSCESPTAYYPVDYEGNRIYSKDDFDVEKIKCLENDGSVSDIYVKKENPCGGHDNTDSNESETDSLPLCSIYPSDNRLEFS